MANREENGSPEEGDDVVLVSPSSPPFRPRGASSCRFTPLDTIRHITKSSTRNRRMHAYAWPISSPGTLYTNWYFTYIYTNTFNLRVFFQQAYEPYLNVAIKSIVAGCSPKWDCIRSSYLCIGTQNDVLCVQPNLGFELAPCSQYASLNSIDPRGNSPSSTWLGT